MGDAYLGDSGDHVLNQGGEGGDGSGLLVAHVPHSESNIITLAFLALPFDLLQLDGLVAEILRDLTFWTFHSDLS